MKFFRVGFHSISLAALLASGNALSQDNGRGERTYKLCTYCHGEQGEGRQDLAAPAIAGLPEWYLKAQLTKFYEGVRGTHPRDLGGMRMRPMAKSLFTNQNDIEAVSKFVAALPRPKLEPTVKGRPIKGQTAYQVCISCHGENGQGNQALNAPPLAGSSDWYLLSQLHNFKAGIRAGDPAKDPTGATMRPMAALLSPESMLDVVSYINVLNQKQQQPKQ
ncbi:c-type cytochrome [Oligoflexus tunisiensis]|uniref:c-type cytochrome n=1 Tax=Oligoflexus tunisiensis TaxID=708132 RepID=UPI00114D37CF|nr:c-type cytochrome [Oligoflexus tunisiensis]